MNGLITYSIKENESLLVQVLCSRAQPKPFSDLKWPICCLLHALAMCGVFAGACMQWITWNSNSPCSGTFRS